MGVKFGSKSFVNHYSLDGNGGGGGGGGGGGNNNSSSVGIMELFLSSPLRTVLLILAATILMALAANIGALNGVGLLNNGHQLEDSSSITLSTINSTISSILEERLSTILSQQEKRLGQREQDEHGRNETTNPLPSYISLNSEANASAHEYDKSIDSQYGLRERQSRVNYSAVWMSDIEIDVVLRHLGDVDKYLEWGSGGSTLNFARFARVRAYSIEHDKKWCSSMEDSITADIELSKVVSYHCIPVVRGTEGWGEKSPFEEGTYRQFRPYVNHIDRLNESTFDFILDDGRARVPAAIKALSYITSNSVVVLHDAERLFSERKSKGHNYYDIWKYYDAIDSVGGIKRQGIVVLKRKSSLKHLQGDHAAVQRILDEQY